eukprot:6040519-Prymnesium_polylepis.1
MYGLLSDASPLAVGVVLDGPATRHVKQYFTVAKTIRAKTKGGAAADVTALWERLRREVASLLWYLFNTLPFERGSSTTILMLHHALFLAPLPAVARERALLCVPMLADHLFPDWEAMSVLLDEWVDDVWYSIFDGRASSKV